VLSGDKQGLLELSNVTRRFGGVVAVNDLSMTINKGVIHGLIGPNGSGKSTTFNLIAGAVAVTAGSITYKGEKITSVPCYRRAALGIGRTFQATDLFDEFTTEENLSVAATLRHRVNFWSTVFRTESYRAEEQKIAAIVDNLIKTLRLSQVRGLMVRDLPHRHQKAVALGNALASQPELLLLDEPAAGLTHVEMDEMMSIYRDLQSSGLTILLVEHNMRAVMGLCDQITVLNQGKKIAEGTAAEISRNEAVVEAYLGIAKT
jgi:branched-chain amino acid transport system ATP-binding protein